MVTPHFDYCYSGSAPSGALIGLQVTGVIMTRGTLVGWFLPTGMQAIGATVAKSRTGGWIGYGIGGRAAPRSYCWMILGPGTLRQLSTRSLSKQTITNFQFGYLSLVRRCPPILN